MSDNPFWINRIIDTGAADPQELAKGFNPLNWRGHPESQREALEEALDSIGILQRVLVNRTSGKVIDGHLRIELAVLKGQPLIPVDYVELTDDEEALALATLDAITEQAQPIPDKLAALMERTREMTAERPGLRAMLDALKERAGVNGNGQETKDAEPQIDKAKELQAKWSTALGQVWEMSSQVDGRPHRVVCGDCTDRAVVEAVMRGEPIEGVVTDPPYGIDWDTDYTRFTTEYGAKRVNYPKVVNDDKEFDPRPYLDFSKVVLWGANWYCQYIPLGSWLVWDKRHLNGAAFLSDAEIAWMKGKRGVYIYQETLQGAHRSERSMHPTQKPVGVMMWSIEKAEIDDLVYDPFLGSGTTLIAAHNLHRIARGIEIDPGYVAVVLQRYLDLTGIEPRLISG